MALLTAALAGCNNSPSTPVDSPVAPGLPDGAVATSPVVTGTGRTEALGVYWLVRDPANPLAATLELPRTAAAQGDLYHLPVGSFMAREHLQVVGTTSGPNNTTDYELRFRHPFAMPADLERPATAQKRADLFLFDVNLVLVAPGSDRFFGDTVRTNLNALVNASGFRQLGPMVDLPALGITDGTNVFPYRLLTNANPSNPAGNYGADGWTGGELLAPTGYDVIPQGGSATTIARVANPLPSPVAVVVVAKYMDPRAGASLVEKRANRLPDPSDPTALRYFLPETSGDLQSITVSVEGELQEGSSSESALVTATALDWDNAATVAASFPNHGAVTQISELSRPAQIEVSLPQLQAAGAFNGYLGNASGVINEFVELTIPISNVDGTYAVANAGGDDLQGLLRVRDTQDTTAPLPYVLDETLNPRAIPPGFEPSTRFQLVTVHINPAPEPAPELNAATPWSGGRSEQVTFRATNGGGQAVSWSWNFGGGATPNTATVASPRVTLDDEGTYTASVTATNASGSDTLEFELLVLGTAPSLPATPFNYANQPLPPYYVDPAVPGSAASSDNTPPNNATTDLGATLGRVLFYDKRLSASNTVSCASCHQQASGFSDPAQFSTGHQGGLTGRHSMGLTNARFYDNGRFFWDERAATLEQQVLMPVQDAVEMGMTLDALVPKIANTSFYPGLFEDAFGDSAVTSDRIARALAQFVRSMVSYQSKEDQAIQAGPGGRQALFTPQELEGFQIFTQNDPGEPSMNCAQCHRTAAQTLGAGPAGPPPAPPPGPFAVNNGLDLDTSGDQGAGQGRFKSPSLRNIAVTAPYMHDGRFANLEAVVDFYAQGVQPHPNLSPLLRVGDQPGNPPERFNLTPAQRDALVAYLNTLTDNAFLTDPKFSNPFPE
ncbi:MAG TPA: cytochrome c peroxidase [bacterium]|nr:cytochrome c peroxidase [bacterium]